MSIKNALEVTRLATISKTFRDAFRQDSAQALSVFAKDLELDGSTPPLTADETTGLQSITDDEFTVFARVAGKIGASLDPGGSVHRSVGVV